jgi:hypothetical protein
LFSNFEKLCSFFIDFRAGVKSIYAHGNFLNSVGKRGTSGKIQKNSIFYKGLLPTPWPRQSFSSGWQGVQVVLSATGNLQKPSSAKFNPKRWCPLQNPPRFEKV